MSENGLQLYLDARRAVKEGPEGLLQRQRRRLSELVNYARENSPLYAELLSEVPEQVEEHRQLPVTSKAVLMENFDRWLTDRKVSYEEVSQFIKDQEHTGQLFHDRYLVCSSSGTSGLPGMFLYDENIISLSGALSARKYKTWLDIREVWGVLSGRLRVAAVIATGAPFAVHAGLVSQQLKSRSARRMIHIISVHSPIPETVAQLNEFRPAILLGYAHTLALLAEEQKAGRLKLKPTLVLLTAEGLEAHEYQDISDIFGCRVHNMYGAAESPELSFDCDEGWHHINADWFIFEPVTADYAPVPAGEPSHTVLLSNLMNRVQPLIRYDLGDSVMQRPDPCLCGCPLPAFRVMGRSSELVMLHNAEGVQVPVAPQQFAAELEPVHGLKQYQITQVKPDRLRIRFVAEPGSESTRVWRSVAEKLGELLSARGLSNVTLERGKKAPAQTEGGKYRSVIPLKNDVSELAEDGGEAG